jgi:hypothetical protein
MNAGELLDLFRKDTVDDTVPYLWSDAEAYAYMNDAYFMFVRLTGGIPDATSNVTTIDIVDGERDAAIDASILRVRQATLVSNDRKIHVINALDTECLTNDDYGIIRQTNNITTPGPVRHMITGLEEGLVRWVQVPEADDVCQLVVERLPLETITASDDEFAGVRVEHHYHLLKWMRHLAYRKQDADTFNLVKSDQEEAAFLAYCLQAKVEKETRRHKVRVVRYGGL